MGQLISVDYPDGRWIKGTYRPEKITPEVLISGNDYQWLWKEFHYRPERFALVKDICLLPEICEVLEAHPDWVIFDAIEAVTGTLEYALRDDKTPIYVIGPAGKLRFSHYAEDAEK